MSRFDESWKRTGGRSRRAVSGGLLRLRAAGDPDERAKRLVDRVGVREELRDVRGEDDDVRALGVPGGVTPALALAEIVLRRHVRITGPAGAPLHSPSSRGWWADGR